MKAKSIGVIALLLAFSGGAFAEMTKDKAMEFTKHDANQDGYISDAEAAQDSNLSQLFSQLDRNVDGRLSPAEFANYEADS